MHFCVYRLYSTSVWTVYLGKLHLKSSTQTEEALRISHINLHPYYDYENHDYDLALLRLERPVSAGTLALPACLPESTHQFEPDLLCWVTGWGALKEGGMVTLKRMYTYNIYTYFAPDILHEKKETKWHSPCMSIYMRDLFPKNNTTISD